MVEGRQQELLKLTAPLGSAGARLRPASELPIYIPFAKGCVLPVRQVKDRQAKDVVTAEAG